MITIIAGGKKPTGWPAAALAEYEKRLKKPYDLHWRFLSEDKFAKYLTSWPFTSGDFVIVCDERGQNISSPAYAQKLQTAFESNKTPVILIGGAYGFDDSATHLSTTTPTIGDQVRAKADFLWSFSGLVFPHALARLIVAEQTYRAQSITHNHPYHHA